MDWKEKLTEATTPAPQAAFDAQKMKEAYELHAMDVELKEHFEAIHPFVKALKVPPTWVEAKPFHGMTFGSRAFFGRGMAVIITVDQIRDAKGVEQPWVHLSVSRKSRMPEYEDLQMVQRFFLDENRPAYQVFPKKEEHRNLHNFCLHLWQPLGDDPFPDVHGDRANTVAP